MPIFERHYTVEEANQALPVLRRVLAEIQELDRRFDEERLVLRRILDNRANDVGGARMRTYWELLVAWRGAVRTVLDLGVLVKDVSRGLVDFPHLHPETGEEVLLCWEASEPAVAFWHTLEDGYRGRQPLPGGRPARRGERRD